ncbi:MAG: hypothetical protein FWC10_01325 [Lentimicrobiaceae bacterium]|nr:hypothetical protein [Lentimicrobiaceae bacterium]
MKKMFLAVCTAIISLAFLATSCPRDEKTPDELIVQKKGWELQTATSVPAYTNFAGVTNENLLVSFFEDCEKDDILYFYDTKSSMMNLGKTICDWNADKKEISLGNWKFRSITDNKADVLEFHLPYFTDDKDNFALLEAKVVNLDENTLTLRIPISFDENPAKSFNGRRVVKTNSKVDPQYQFTFIYKIAK